MEFFKKKEPNQQTPKIETGEQVQKEDETHRIRHELTEMKHENLTRKVIEQEIIIRRLLELVVMNIEHKAYDKMMPKIDAIKNMLDKK